MKNYLVLCLLPIALYSAPSHPEVKHGKASFHGNKIEASDKAIIHWKDFSIEAGEAVQFVQPNSKSVVLNRVVGGKMSHLMGTVEANGHVYLINPQGILIGKDAVINTAGFTASALDVLDDDFINGKELLFKGDSRAPVTNLGMIIALDGDATLIGYQVSNEGSMIAPEGTAALAAGFEVILKPNSEEHIFIRPSNEERMNETGVSQSGIIDAVKAEIKADGNLYGVAICHEGKTQAAALQKSDGKIFLVAEGGIATVNGAIEARSGTIRVLAKAIDIIETAVIDVSGAEGGGTIWIGGDPQGTRDDILHADIVRVQRGASLIADGLESSDGGEIIMFALNTAIFHGNASAEGGPEGGNGGFIELSGKQKFDLTGGKVSTKAPLGETGVFLLDPNTFTISSAPSSGTLLPSPPYLPLLLPAETIGNIFSINNPLGAVNLATSDLQTALASSNVFIVSIADISLSAASPIIWSTSNYLELEPAAGFGVTLNSSITCTGGGSVIINSDMDVDVLGGISISGVPYTPGTLAAPVPQINITSTNGAIQIASPVLVTSGFGDIILTTTNGSGGVGLITIANMLGCMEGGNVFITATADGLFLNSTATDVEVFTPGGQPTIIGFGITIKTGDSIQVGDSKGLHHAQIGCNHDTLSTLSSFDCDIIINCSANVSTNPISLFLNAGTGATDAYAQIGHRGGAATSSLTINGSVFVAVGGSDVMSTVNLNSGNQANSYTQIGHSPSTGTAATTIQCAAISMDAPSAFGMTGTFQANLQGGSGPGCYSLIGNGGVPASGSGGLVTYDGEHFNPNFDPPILLTPSFQVSPNTTVSVQTQMLSLNGGNATDSFAAIGVAGVANCTFASPYRVIVGAQGFGTSAINLTAGGATGTNANAGAHIGVFLEGANPLTLSSPAIHILEVEVAGSTGGALTLTTPAGTSIAAIGTGSNLAGAVIGSKINMLTSTLTGSADISITPTTANAFIQTGTGAFPTAYINMESLTNINVTSTSTAQAYIACQGDALLFAGLDVVMVGDPVNLATISSTNNLMIVTDNAAFGIGPGGFQFDANSTLTSGGGIPIYIWTAVQGQNTTNGLFNGQPFGSIFTESGITWHQGFTVNPFAALFYK